MTNIAMTADSVTLKKMGIAAHSLLELVRADTLSKERLETRPLHDPPAIIPPSSLDRSRWHLSEPRIQCARQVLKQKGSRKRERRSDWHGFYKNGLPEKSLLLMMMLHLHLYDPQHHGRRPAEGGGAGRALDCRGSGNVQ